MPTIHASVVLVGARALLIRGASGAGKSRLALALLQAADRGEEIFARLVADDRVDLEARNGLLLCRPPESLAGLLEVRGLGILRFPHEPVAAAGLIADLGTEPPRLPDTADSVATIGGVTLPRIAFAPCADPLPVLLAALRARPFQP